MGHSALAWEFLQAERKCLHSQAWGSLGRLRMGPWLLSVFLEICLPFLPLLFFLWLDLHMSYNSLYGAYSHVLFGCFLKSEHSLPIQMVS